MDDLFSASTRERSFQNAPLAVRMRPNSLDEYVGQQKAVGKGSWLRAAIEHDVLSSVILYGPAGTGKTTLAHIIANHTKSEFVEVSAVTGTVKDLRRVIDEAKTRLNTYDRRTILFIDEIHRFSKSQQDALLHAVENLRAQLLENPNALTDFLARFPQADSQQLRALIRNAKKEQAENKPPKAFRELYRQIKVLVNGQQQPGALPTSETPRELVE